MIDRLTLEEIEHITFSLARKEYGHFEHMPDFNTRFPNILESCLAQPFQTFGKKQLYPSFINKASILFYLMIKNHPFQNGNKRVAVATLLYFLSKYGKWLDLETKTLYNLALAVSESDPKKKDKAIKFISEVIDLFVVDY